MKLWIGRMYSLYGDHNNNIPYYSAYSWFNPALSTVHYYPDSDLFNPAHTSTHGGAYIPCCRNQRKGLISHEAISPCQVLSYGWVNQQLRTRPGWWQYYRLAQRFMSTQSGEMGVPVKLNLHSTNMWSKYVKRHYMKHHTDILKMNLLYYSLCLQDYSIYTRLNPSYIYIYLDGAHHLVHGLIHLISLLMKQINYGTRSRNINHNTHKV
jgi:hypothetical protein